MKGAIIVIKALNVKIFGTKFIKFFILQLSYTLFEDKNERLKKKTRKNLKSV